MEINQNTSVDEAKVRDLIEGQGTLYLRVNLQLIEDDINRLKKRLDKVNSSITQKNIEMTIKYLEGIKRKASSSQMSLSWSVYNGRIISKPVEVRKIDSLDINMTDYIMLDDKALVHIDYSDLLNAIALEMGHRDFCIESKDAEEKLKDISIISINDINILKDRGLLEDDMAVALMSAYIEDTPYVSDDTKDRYNYFGKNIGNGKTYREMMESSTDYTMLNLVYNIFNTASDLDIGVYICGVYEKSISIITDIDAASKLKEAIEYNKVIVRVFGRRFEIIPKITVY